MTLWSDGAPVFVSGLRPFHPLFFIPASVLFILGMATVLFSGWRFVRDPRRARFYELTVVTALAILGTGPNLLPFVVVAAALPALRLRSALASFALAALLAAPWWLPGLEAVRSCEWRVARNCSQPATRNSQREAQLATRSPQLATFRFVPFTAADHVPGKIARMAGELPDVSRGGRLQPLDAFSVRVHSNGWNLLAAPHGWWPGWRVYREGERLPPVRVDGAFAGTFVPPGDAVIRFRYRPKSFETGLRLAALGLILLAAWPLIEKIRIPLKVLAIAALTIYAAILIAHRCGIAGGSDSSGYLNQARLWRSGTLSVPVESEQHIPLGFVNGTRPQTMVPSYPPGLPLLMALLGDRGSAFLSPIAAVLCVLLVVRIAKDLGIDDERAMAAAAILALSPAFLFMAVQPMSDVVSTFWALLCVLCAIRGRDRTHFAIAAGVSFGIGVLVRPTHVLLLPAMIALLGWRRLLPFMAGGVPFAAFQLILANHWYGSPFASGYGSISESLALRYFPTRFVHYSTSLAFLFPLAFPFGLLKRRAALWLWFAPFFLFYCFYQPYETWWYTRFLLPAIPAVLLLAASFRIPRAALLTIVVAIAATQLVTARHFHVLDVAKREAVYEHAATMAKRHVPRNATLLASQHSGSLLFYANRTALRFDLIDRAPEQRPLYAVVSPNEILPLQQRIPGPWTEIARAGDTALLHLP